MIFALFLTVLIYPPVCSSLNPTVDQDTVTADYNGLTLQVLTNSDPVVMETVTTVALEKHNWHGLTNADNIDKLVTIGLLETELENFQNSLRQEEIQMSSLSEVDKFVVTTGVEGGESSLTFADDLFLRNNLDPSGYDFSLIWDVDTIYNYINHTTSQVEWMEELSHDMGDGRPPLKIVKVSRHPGSTYKDQRVHVFMSSWDGGQWLSIKTVLRMLDRFLTYDADLSDEIHALVSRNTLYLIPLPNPEGYTQTIDTNRFWNKNLNTVTNGDFSCVGVDLELNAREAVSTAVAGKDCYLEFDGSGPFSESEVTIIMGFATDLISNAGKPVFWFQFDELYKSVLVQPYTDGDISGSPPNYTDILDYYKERKEAIVGDIEFKVPYGLALGQDAIYPLPESYFLQVLTTRGITKTYLVGIPLTLEERLIPVNEVGSEYSEKFSLSLLRAVNTLTTVTPALETYGPIIGPVVMVTAVILLLGSITIVFAMHEDTKRLENERADAYVDVPRHVRALGAQRQYETEVIAGKKVRKRTIGGDDSSHDRLV